jgi:hypothetical protein
MTRLSSSATTWHKTVFPTLWLSMFGIGAIVSLLPGGSKDMLPAFPIILPCMWLFGLGLVFFLCFPLKHVSLVGSVLKVRDRKQEIEIPLSEVASISGSSMGKPETITLRLRHATAFGSKIKFVASYRFFTFGPHPTVKLLRELMEKERL